MKLKHIKEVLVIIVTVIVVFFLCTNNIQCTNCGYLEIFWNNMKLISEILYTTVPLLIILLLFFLVITNKWAFRVEKMNIGGFSILFDNPVRIYKRQVKNYLDTKRTVFEIDLANDNFSETLDSYYEIYKFFREEIKMLGEVSESRIRETDRMRLYKIANETLRVLNRFLTQNQNNYRRWYAYLEMKKEEEYYLTPIGILQKQYPDYAKLCSGFEQVNKYFRSKVASEFGIDIKKWEWHN